MSKCYCCDFCGKEIKESPPCSFRVVGEEDKGLNPYGLIRRFIIELQLDSGNGERHVCPNCAANFVY